MPMPTPAAGTAVGAAGGGAAQPLQARLHEQEKNEIVAAIDRNQGNIAGAARALGINRSTLYYRLRKHGLEHLLPTKPQGREAALTMRVLVVMDPIERINPEGDTTLVLVEEMHRRGHAVEVCGAEELELERGEAAAVVSTVTGGRSHGLPLHQAAKAASGARSATTTRS